jgi:hypothetical protein
MLVHANLYRAIEDERSGTLRLFQRFEHRDGPDLTAVFQPDSALTAPTQRHNMAVQQLTAFSVCARYLTTTPVVHPRAPLAVTVRPDWSVAALPQYSGQQ